MAEQYIAQVSEKFEVKVNDKRSQEISRTESRIFGALSQLGEFLLNPQVRISSGNIQEQQPRKPGTHWGSLSGQSLSRGGVLCLPH